jgi:hypothetical protein
LTISSIAALFLKSESPSKALFLKSGSPTKMAQGEVRCEGAGAIVINIDGADYAVNGTPPPFPKVTSTALSFAASPFAIGV